MKIKSTLSAGLLLMATAGCATAPSAKVSVASANTKVATETVDTGPLAHIDTTAFEAAMKDAADNDSAPQNQTRTRNTAIGHGKGFFIDTYDTNGDGEVAITEFVAERDAGYARRDHNNDGQVHLEEYVSEFEVRLEKQLEERRERQIDAANFRFTVLDTDDNETMSIEEFHASSKRMFSRLDSNGDGVVNDADTAKSF